jgi:hypothetical protein
MLELENEAGLSTGLNVGVPLAIRATIIATVNTNTKPTRTANRCIYIKMNHSPNSFRVSE